jgi:hypothetical protein
MEDMNQPVYSGCGESHSEDLPSGTNNLKEWADFTAIQLKRAKAKLFYIPLQGYGCEVFSGNQTASPRITS